MTASPTNIVETTLHNPRALERVLSGIGLQERLDFLVNAFRQPVFRSVFGLSDQVLTHALVSSNLIGSNLQTEARKQVGTRESLARITEERYAVSFRSEGATDADLVIAGTGELVRTDPITGTLIVNPVADWTEDQKVSYVLDHEVPVDPADMPGVLHEAA